MQTPHPLYTIACPQVDASAQAFVDGVRRQHDPQVDQVAPHFTLVFGCSAVAEADYLAHVARLARHTPAIRFHCRHATLHAGGPDGMAHVFLVPDEGHSAIALLHDRLHTGVLAAHLRLDIPYVPHITVAATRDVAAAKALCDGLNEQGVDIAGELRLLSVGMLQGGQWHTLGECPLAIPA
ncbi:2'-5' RNA ligase [Acidovorax soli]|uniref:2'-5' RNA ligase n=1 Tax=Acidovorax soli TaxID=592050 RepID=A0A7X0PKU6_9BURK|nr:2'-5' RNA ligase family protein [Acidovorax soli]MBB6563823.1 2'-5' RNA ligase [Acidovorax soli]